MATVQEPPCPAQRETRQPPPRGAPQPPPRGAPQPPPRVAPQPPPRGAPQPPPRGAPKPQPLGAPQPPPRAAPQPPPRPSPQPSPRASPQKPSPPDSVFTYSSPESGEEWEPYYYYNNANQPVTPGHNFSESDFAPTGSTGRKRGGVSVGATSPQGATGEDCPFPGGATGDLPQRIQSPEYSTRQSQVYGSVASSPSEKSRQGIPSVRNPSPFTTPTRRPLVGPFSRPSSARPGKSAVVRDEVFTYSAPPTGQEEWEQYYYYPSPSPGHTKMGSYIQTPPSSESLAMKRQRIPLDANIQEAAGMGLQEFDRTSPSLRTKERSTAAPPLPSRTPSVGPMSDQQRRKLSIHYSDINSPNTPASPKGAENRQLADDSVFQTPPKLRRLPVMSPSELEDTSIYVDSPLTSTPYTLPHPSPPRSSAREKSFERRGSAKSTPEAGRTLFNIDSISPVPKRGLSREYFEGQDSLETYSCPPTSEDNNFEFTEDELNRSYPQDPSRQSGAFGSEPDRRRSYSNSALPRNPNQGAVASCNVEVLTTGTFSNFLKEQEMTVVMFHNSLVNKQEDLQSWAKPSPQLPPTMNQAFALVDCAAEPYLCGKEGIATFPYFKIYYRGSLVNAVKDLATVNLKICL